MQLPLSVVVLLLLLLLIVPYARELVNLPEVLLLLLLLLVLLQRRVHCSWFSSSHTFMDLLKRDIFNFIVIVILIKLIIVGLLIFGVIVAVAVIVMRPPNGMSSPAYAARVRGVRFRRSRLGMTVRARKADIKHPR